MYVFFEMFYRFGLEIRRDVGSRLTFVYVVLFYVFVFDFGVDCYMCCGF